VSGGRRLAFVALLVALAFPAGANARVRASPYSPARPQARLQLVLPLAGDEAGLTRFADAVSTPGSPDYGRYGSISWLAHRFGAGAAVRRRVVAYLRAHGATHVVADATAQFVYARMDVAHAEALFRTSLARERGAHDAGFIAPVTAVRVPRPLRGLVTGVVGLDTAAVAAQSPQPSPGTQSPQSSPGPQTQPSSYPGPDPAATPAGCAAGVGTRGFTPNEYLGAYGYSTLQQQGIRGQGERIAVIEIDGFNAQDVATFAHCFHLATPTINQLGVDLSKPLAPGGEATLDLEVLDAAAPGLKAIDVYETRPDAADVLKALSQPLQSQGFKPEVISASLGLCENEAVAGVGQSGIRAIETTLKLAAAAGVTVVSASGDSGSSDCADPNTNPPTPSPVLAVNFPSSSPWVTSVGGVNFNLNAQNQIVSQTVWNDGLAFPGNAGGGGVSMLFARPSWQNGTVSSPWRAQPDVALLADVAPGYDVFCTARQNCAGHGWQTFGGTSAATPLMAGGFALVDEALRRGGRQALGLANPLLYRLGRNPVTAPQVFYDVTSGTNDIGQFIQSYRQPLGCCNAQPGYDTASGWGGVNLPALSQQALALQPTLAAISVTIPGGQQPYRHHGIYVNISCSRACDMSAYARLSAPGMDTFTVYAPPGHMVRANHRLIKIPFTAQQLLLLAPPLLAHRPITAVVAGANVDPSGNVENHTPLQQLTITS